MDKNSVAAFVNSPVMRILKLGTGTALIGYGARLIARQNPVGAIPAALGTLLAGNATLDLCPINLLLGLPIDSRRARPQI